MRTGAGRLNWQRTRSTPPLLPAYLREQERAAEARDAEQAAAEAAVRRARNERRRQKNQKGKARRRASEGPGAGGEEEEQEEQELAAAIAGLSAGDTAAAGAEKEAGAEAAIDDRKAAAAAAPAAATDAEEDEGMLEAAIALSLSIDRPPPLKEYLEADAPDGLLCPISMALLDDPVALLDDPVVLAADGITYSRAAIEQHFAFCRERGKPLSSPCTNEQITDSALTMLVPNALVHGQVLEYKAAKERAWAEAERQWQEAGGEMGAKYRRTDRRL